MVLVLVIMSGSSIIDTAYLSVSQMCVVWLHPLQCFSKPLSLVSQQIRLYLIELFVCNSLACYLIKMLHTDIQCSF